MKPILFNTDMVYAILENRKHTTRRPIKPQPTYSPNDGFSWKGAAYGTDIPQTIDGAAYFFSKFAAFYHPKDIAYVRETWCEFPKGRYHFKADALTNLDEFFFQAVTDAKWHPSIHMPHEAARIFLLMNGTRVERVQDITDAGAQDEGITWRSYRYVDDNGVLQTVESKLPPELGATYRNTFAGLWDSIYAAPQPVKSHGEIVSYISFPWDDIQIASEYKGLPWYIYGNPFVFVYSFERCEKPEREE